MCYRSIKFVAQNELFAWRPSACCMGVLETAVILQNTTRKTLCQSLNINSVQNDKNVRGCTRIEYIKCNLLVWSLLRPLFQKFNRWIDKKKTFYNQYYVSAFNHVWKYISTPFYISLSSYEQQA